MAQAIAKLAAATQSNQTTVANLVAANSTLMEQVANMSICLSDKDSEIALLRLSIDKLTVSLQHLGLVPPKESTPRNYCQRKPKATGELKVTITYCWTCGTNTTHTGKDCCNKQQGHKDTATLQNRLGGNERGMQE
eukprot:11899947-Ditylum_brightwellii.AAC.1